MTELAAPHPSHRATLAILAVAALSFALSQTMVIPALPAIREELGASSSAATWILTIYLLAAAVATPIAGRLGDMFGKGRVLVIALTIFGVGSLASALSESIGLLIAGRAIQGVGGAVFPLAFGIIRDEFPRERVALGLGLISATFGVGGGIGLVVAGPLVGQFGYESIFWLGLVVVAIAIVTSHLYIPESPVRSAARIDFGGAALLSAGLVALLLGVSEGNSWGWGSPPVLALIVGGVAILAVWVRYERGVADPLVDMQMMSDRPVFTTNMVAFLVGFGMFGSFILVPQFVQTPSSAGYGFDATVSQAGLFMAPSAAVMLFAGPLAGKLGSHFGSKLTLMVGTVAAASALTLMAAVHGSALGLILANALLGLGIGFAFASMANLVVEAVDQSQTGVATGMNTIMRMIGGALGAQLTASVVAASSGGAGALPTETGYTVAFLIGATGAGAAFMLALAIPSPERRRRLGAEPARAAA